MSDDDQVVSMAAPNEGSVSITPSNDEEQPAILDNDSVESTNLENLPYDEATLRQEFATYQHVLPNPDQLLQEKPSVPLLRQRLTAHGLELPRFLRHPHDTPSAIHPHHALCSLLWHDYDTFGPQLQRRSSSTRGGGGGSVSSFYAASVRYCTLGTLAPQWSHPAALMREQFARAAPAISRTHVVAPEVLRHRIRDYGRPIPNYLLDPEDPRQFPPHIALLVLLQDGHDERKKLDNVWYHIGFSIFAFVALCLRIVLEVIGGAGAIWGGAEVFGVRTAHNASVWRWISVAVGVLCLLRFVALNVPQPDDAGDTLGPAGPWSLPFPARLRAVCHHPFHYFVRAAVPDATARSKMD